MTTLPTELTARPQWVVWRVEERDGRLTKVPYEPRTQRRAKTDDPKTGGTFEEAVKALQTRQYQRLGFVRTEDLVFIDLDGCRDPESGRITQPWAQKVLQALAGKAYAETSPSGTGAHLIARGRLPLGRRQWDSPDADHVGFAFYDGARYFTITGSVLPESGPITDCTLELAQLHAELFSRTTKDPKQPAALPTPGDDELIRRARGARDGSKFSRLFDGGDTTDYGGDDSAADMALMLMLAFWTGRDPGRMERLFSRSALGARNKWRHRKDYRERTLNAAIEHCSDTYSPESYRRVGTHGHERPPDLTRFPLTDTGNAERMRVLFGPDLHYCHEMKRWLIWDGRRWQIDPSRTVSNLAKKAARLLYAQAADLPDSTTDQVKIRSATEKHARRSESAKGRKDALDCLAAEQDGIPISETELDPDPFLLNTLTGTVDLRTGQIREHRRADLISKLIPIAYDPRAEAPRFLQFIHRIMGGGPDASEADLERADRLVNYLQRGFGCAATGRPQKLLFVLYGTGNNGKTTLLELIRSALGDREYAGQVAIDSLMIRPREAVSNNAVNSDLADLRGCRFVSSSEVEQGQKLSLSRVKYLTGLSQIKARRLGQDWITFNPTHTLFIDANHKPVITDPHDAIWNRVKCIPFAVKIPDDEIDPELPFKLRAELPGILRWVVEGAVDYLEYGLGEPPEVIAATEEYRDESDRLREFLADCCVVEPENKKSWIPVARLWPAYEMWAEKNGEKYPLPKSVFDERLQRLGCAKSVREDGTVRAWVGIRLKTDNDDKVTANRDSTGSVP